MEQTALIVSIVAVVLGALGLIGGVIGYVQGTAALRRATLTRQRASAAEEAALQARTQAEQAARTAQSVLDRLSGIRGVGDLADLPTGPLVLPPRLAPPRTGELPRFAPAPREEPESPFARPATAPTPVFEPMPIPIDVAGSPAESTPVELEPAQSSYFTAPIPVAPEPEPEPEPERAPVPSATDPSEIRVTEPEPTVESEPISATGSIEVAPVEPEPVAAEPEPEPEPVMEAPPERSATGQVNARGQQVSMDWAEALRTGAIPLPSRSRRSYAAPSKAAGQPVGPPRFEIRVVGRQKWEAVNVGGATAEQASIEGAGDDSHLVRPFEARPKPVQPGASLAFSVLRVEGRTVSVRISWMLNGDEEWAELPLP